MKPLKQLLSIVFFIVVPSCLIAQNPAMTWYFGNQAGIDFANGTATPITNGAMQSSEGSAVISDQQGDLLFYTNGGDLPYSGGIWNKNHQLMPNGNMNNVGSCNSSFQNSLILPQPRGDGNIFYMFTTDCIENNNAGGLRYTVIDMNLDGGLGDVVVKADSLMGPTTESLAAVEHAQGKGYWVITHEKGSDSFYAFHLTHGGITSVVESSIGPVPSTYAGGITASSNGQKLAFSMYNETGLFDFNPKTGEVTNYHDLEVASYSNAFSPDCEQLYLANAWEGELYQVNVMAQAPSSSVQLVDSTSADGIGALQLAPNGKIYAARFFSSNYLGVIETPNQEGAGCDYQDKGFYLGGKVSTVGLPNFANNFVGDCASYPEPGDDKPGYDDPYESYYADVKVDQVNNGSAQLEWTQVDDASGYEVKSVNLATGDVENYSTKSNKLKVSGLEEESKYHFSVYPEKEATSTYQPLDHYLAKDFAEHGTYTTSTDNAVEVTTTKDIEVDVYPNPARSEANISLAVGNEADAVKVDVMDAQGKTLQSYSKRNVSGKVNLDVNVEDLASGMYQVAVESGSYNGNHKLVVAD
jgi:hypothetical protein